MPGELPDGSTCTLRVVGVGASAGGLEAMLPMFANVQPTGRLAYVVAQHMAHGAHTDLVARLIQRESLLPVQVPEDGMRLEADTVYVIPSGCDGQVKDGTLRLCEPRPEHLSTPSVNALFASIATACRSQAIGIVLSGTGSDGVSGCRAIKASGGITFVQDPAEAKYAGMPEAAIEARVADRVLPVDRMGAALAALVPDGVVPPPAARPPVRVAAAPVAAVPDIRRRELDRLVAQIFDATGIDFADYKEDTLLRRLEKRKATLGLDSAEAYQALIAREPRELKVLQRLFLVSTSSFFRDRESFRALEQALAVIVAGKADGESVRVWVPGCASGEESYTLAIILSELLGADRGRIPMAIIATDLNGEALATAKDGTYRQTALREMEPALRERYFEPHGQHFRVKPDLMAYVDFQQRDVFEGEPPANLDLVSCRNLMIYMKSDLQDRLLKRFYGALHPGGLLFLGPSESVGFAGEALFAPLDNYHRLFRRRP